MGGEHSRESAAAGVETGDAEEVTVSTGLDGENLGDDIAGRDSPRPSICSDGDLPYISYTVNRPIGESPKHMSKGVRSLRPGGGGGTGLARRQRKRLGRPQEVVVVKEANTNKPTVDLELARLQNIPTFLPIMRGALTAPSARDPEVLERLDVAAFAGLCRRYQIHLHACASFVANHQDNLTAKIREVDSQVNELVSCVTERQRAYARYAERLSQVTEVSHLLARCHTNLNLILESMDALNNFLNVDERLEPFIWTTG